MRLRKFAIASVFLTTSAFAQPVVIAMLGDSLTQGYGLPVDEGLVPQLELWLQGRGADVKLINAGVSGDTTAGGLARAAWTLTPDIQGLIVALGANDMLRGIDPASVRLNLSGIMAAAQEAGVPALLVGFPAPGNYGPDYKQQFDVIYPELAGEFGALHLENLLTPIEDATAQGAELSDLLQADRLHPNPKGVALIIDGLGPKVLNLIERIE